MTGSSDDFAIVLPRRVEERWTYQSLPIGLRYWWAVGGWVRRKATLAVANWDFSGWIRAYTTCVTASVAFIASLFIWCGWFIEVLARVLG